MSFSLGRFLGFMDNIVSTRSLASKIEIIEMWLSKSVNMGSNHVCIGKFV